MYKNSFETACLVAAAENPHDQQQQDGSDKGGDHLGQKAISNGDPQQAEQVAANKPAQDADNNGPEQTNSNALDNGIGQQTGDQTYRHLDAAQLVKHACGLRTQALKRARGAVLVYLHASPGDWANGKPVDPAAIVRHQTEITHFANAVKGDDVVFAPVRWVDVLAQWARLPALAEHAKAVARGFGPI